MTTGGAKEALHAEFGKLSEDEQKAVKQELDAHQKYVDDIHIASAARIKAVIKRTHSSPFGPGAFLARWQQLMDNTLVTPATFQGPVRYGNTQSVKAENRKDVDGSSITGGVLDDKPIVAPKVDNTLRLLAPQFRVALARG
jgi:glycine/D-amino acid oxidase-like deaminating enzyme